MHLVKQAILRKSVISVFLTAVIITVLVLIGPRAQAVEILISGISSSFPGSPVSFTVTVNVENTDLLPIYRVNLNIKNQDQPGTYTRSCTDLPRLADTKNYPDATKGNISVTSTTSAGWSGASGSRFGYGYSYPSGPPNTYETGSGYGYGYVGGGSSTSITYNVTWTTPSTWPSGAYIIEVLVYVDNGSTPFTHPTAYTFTLNTSGGGGGGGGGGGLVGVLAFGYIIDSQGKLTQEARAIAENGEAYLILSAGTYCLLDGYPLTFIYIRPPYDTEPTPTDPDFGEYATRYFNLGPDGSTFDPPIKLIFNYKESLIPEGFSEEDLSIYTWDEVLGEWEKLESQINPENNTISCFISHFSGFAVIAAPESEPEPTDNEPEPTDNEPEPTDNEPEPTDNEPEPTDNEPEPTDNEPEPTQEPNSEPNVESTVVPPTTVPFDIVEDKGMNQWALAGIVFGVAIVIVAVAVYLIRYKRILD